MPRNKRTEGPKIDAMDLPDLTHKQLGFVRGVLEGKTASDAYRHAYEAENMSDEAIWVEASRLRHDPNVSLWIQAARSANMDRAVLTIDGHMAELARLRDIAIATGNVGAAVLAETNRGKASGLYTERHEDVTKGREGGISVYAQLLKHSPELARAFAQAAGLDTQDIDPQASESGESQLTH